jgi:hypothetical protein
MKIRKMQTATGDPLRLKFTPEHQTILKKYTDFPKLF